MGGGAGGSVDSFNIRLRPRYVEVGSGLMGIPSALISGTNSSCSFSALWARRRPRYVLSEGRGGEAGGASVTGIGGGRRLGVETGVVLRRPRKLLAGIGGDSPRSRSSSGRKDGIMGSCSEGGL